MLKLFRRLKRDWLWILLIIGLLLVQVTSDLALPEYTSKIVDTGIQQKGVEDAVPETIRKSSLDQLLRLMKKDDQKLVKSSYKEDGSLYDLKKIDKDTRSQLNDTMSKAEMIVSYMAQQKMDFSKIPDAQIPAILKQADTMLKQYPDSVLTQAAVLYVQAEYKAQGIDMDAHQTHYIVSSGVHMLLLALLSMICAILVTFTASRVSAKFSKNLRHDIYAKVLTFSSNEMNQFSTSSLITRSTNDIQQIQVVMILIFRIVLYAPMLAIGGVIKVLNTGRYLSWLLVVAVIVLFIVMITLFAIVSPKFKKLQALIDRVNLISREILTGIPVIRAFSTEKHEERRFDDANKDLTKTNLFVNRVMSMMMPLMMVIMNVVSVSIVYFGAHGIDQGKLQVGDMMAFIQYAMQIIMAFLMISAVAVFMPRASVSASRVNEILDTDPDVKNPEHPELPQTDEKGDLEFRDVSFSYPGSEEPSLQHISFHVRKGETIAFIGSTGSGKSTLVNLLPRYFDVTSGEILLDGEDIRRFDLKELRSRIGFVPQKSLLFTGTIASNLRFGKENATDEELEKALDISQATEFVSKKKDGINAPIAQGGSNVSGGQKQRLAIARAVTRQPEVYVFDDSFSALDFKTDAQLRAALKKETGDVTTLLVAQRVGTIMNADQIIVLENGQVVGHGTHKELMKSCSVYQQIAKSQLSEEELANA